MQSFLEILKTRPMLADGGMGTLLYSRGASHEATFEHLNLTKQEVVQQVHVDYINAGAEIIETNSFSGNRIKLATHGLEGDVWKVNVWAAKIARNAREIAGQPVFVAGSIGPTGKLLPPLGDTDRDELDYTYREQMEALLAGGVDLFCIETMSSLDETAIAIKAARKVSKLPVVAQISFSVEGHTLLGATPEDTVRLITELGDEMPDVLGINCGAGPGPSFDSLLRLTEAVKALKLPEGRITFSCLPNAGQPSLSGGRPVFASKPHYCASYIEPYLRAGAKIVGGCCGTTPEHIRAMAESLNRYQSEFEAGRMPSEKQKTILYHVDSDTTESADHGPVTVQTAVKQPLPAKAEKKYKNLADHLRAIKKAGTAKDDFFISVELDPPKGAGVKKLLQAAEVLTRAGADAINVGDSPMARVRMSSLSACQLISQNVGIDTIIHFTTRDRNLMGMQADLLGCQALGLHNILALTGDPPALGNYAHATAVYDVDSIGLINIIAKLNAGQDIAGNTIGTPLTLSIGCALNPTAQNRTLELERIKRKIEAGADFIMTQPIYQTSDLTDFLEEMGECSVPILIGIMPLHSSKHAEYLHNEVPGISIPKHIREAMREAGEAGAKCGLTLAEELLAELADLCQGTYLVPSFGRYEDMAALVSRLKAKFASAKAAV
ncbi:MAG: bifunctional homocysteine S-methyltransferase/methylenetetrahydrofolate reductase [Cyanobacteria bacterium SZAS LIN-3]|nr:bifunctional homocysteine S-methyltransferase/methylenetetrahydrofolate reductase [Cyanobacteria bacterium SZAS LIN-3]